MNWTIVAHLSLGRVGRIIGTGIFSTPSSILGSVGSVGASLMLWVFGFFLSACGLFIWLEYGTMIPRSGGEKVYLEAIYKRPRYLATTVFAVNAILLVFSSANNIVSGIPFVKHALICIVTGFRQQVCLPRLHSAQLDANITLHRTKYSSRCRTKCYSME